MLPRRRKITEHYEVLRTIRLVDLVKIARAYVFMAQMPPEALGLAFVDTTDQRGAKIAPSVDPAWLFNVAVVLRLAELAADYYDGDSRRKDRTTFLRLVGVWNRKTLPTADMVKRYRDLWPDQDRIDGVILEAWSDLRAKGRITPQIVLFP